MAEAWLMACVVADGLADDLLADGMGVIEWCGPAAQRLLVERECKECDGKEGKHPIAEKTIAAIKQLQAKAGLPVTGVADAATKAMLLNPRRPTHSDMRISLVA